MTLRWLNRPDRFALHGYNLESEGTEEVNSYDTLAAGDHVELKFMKEMSLIGESGGDCTELSDWSTRVGA